MRRARAVFRPNVKSVAAAASRGKPPATKELPAKVIDDKPKDDDKQEKTTVTTAEPESKQQPETAAKKVSTPPSQKTDSNSSARPAAPNKATSKQKEISAEQSDDKNASKNTTDSCNTNNTLSNNADKNKTTTVNNKTAAVKTQKEVKTSSNEGQKSATVAGRRKRVMAVPNLGRRRQGASAPGKPTVTEKEPTPSDGEKKEEAGQKQFQEPPPVQRMSEAFGSKPPPRHIPPLVIPRRRLDSTSSVDGREGSERPLTIPHRERRVSGMYTPNIQPERRREKEQEEEEGPAKRRQRHNQSKPPDKNRMTMADLIYYNPKVNMMKSTEEKAKKQKEKKKQKQEVDAASEMDQEEEEEREEELLEEDGSQDQPPVDEDPDVDDSLLVPQVRVAEDGTIVLNEQTLTVSTPAKKAGSDIIQEDESNTTYSSFRKKVPQTQAWNMKETIKFYKALSTVGTDFTLMAAMLPKRTRTQLKAKFKKEEKQNRTLVDRALSLRQEFDQSIFDQSDSDSEDEKKKKDQASRRGKGRPRGAENEESGQSGGKRKASGERDGEPVPVRCVMSSPLTVSPKNAAGFPSYGTARPDTSRDGAEAGTREHTEDADDENEDEETRIVQMLKGPTRAGRQPKRVQTFSINVEPTKKRPRPPTVVNRASPIGSPPRFSPGQSPVGSSPRKRWLYIPGETGPRAERNQSQESSREDANEPIQELVETVMIQSPVRFESPEMQQQPIPQLIQGTALNGSVVVGDVEELVFTDEEGNRPTATTTAQYTLVIPVVGTSSSSGQQTVSVVVPSSSNSSSGQQTVSVVVPSSSNSPSGQQTVSVVVPSSSSAHNTSLDANTSGGSERLSLSFVTGEHLTARDILEQMQMEGRRGEEEEEEEEVPVVIGEEMITEIVTEMAKEQPDVDSTVDKGAAGLEAES
ncbi:Hypp1558 [Branchiostoma lanceolatum]|uniref:Hypp1558 protein n=1 Tax=Branchiostoma lanceolatum TaxID=7740 RepID=A0A8K0ELC9_BRALA|nr:Hypp1558 [Branchiostoma lanceolatum]